MSEVFVSHESSALVELLPLPTYDNLRGEQAQRRWRGPRSLVIAKYNSLKSTGVQTMRLAEIGDGVALELVADYAGTVRDDNTIDAAATPVLTDWTLEPVQFSKSIWQHPAVLTELNILGRDEPGLKARQTVRNAVDALVRGDTTFPDYTDKENKRTVPLSSVVFLDYCSKIGLSRTVMASFLSDQLEGVTSYTPDSWTLRRTRRVPSASSFSESSVNVGRCLLPSSLSSEGFTASQLRVDLPAGGYWLKLAPSDRPIGDGNREVVTDFVWTEKFSFFLYGLPV
jgi:hypothetical protein